jgi:formylmethanofuran dehydrogenase subunit E
MLTKNTCIGGGWNQTLLQCSVCGTEEVTQLIDYINDEPVCLTCINNNIQPMEKNNDQ